MDALLVTHVAAGALGLGSGYVALFATKGATVHRRSGAVFVAVMLTMSLSGLLIAALRGVAPAINIPAAVLTAYLVVTSLAALRPPRSGARALHAAALLVALGVGVTCMTFAVQALAAGGSRNGMPAFPFVMFGVVGLLAAALDLRVLRSGPLRGTARLRRHLWRMCFALFIAAMSFFLGQADEIPASLRNPLLLAVPVVIVPIAMFAWLWRTRGGRAGPSPAVRPRPVLRGPAPAPGSAPGTGR